MRACSVGDLPAGSAGRIPRLDGSVTEALLAEVNRRAWAVSCSVLQDLFPGFDLPRMVQTTDAATLLVGSAGPAISSLGEPLELLDRILGRADLLHPRLKVVREGQADDAARVAPRHRSVPAGRSGVVNGVAWESLDAGYTLVLDGIESHEAVVQRWVEHLERAFASYVNINAYVGYRPQQGFGPHWDDHEVIIVQLIGAKRWVVHQPAGLSMHRAIHDDHITGKLVWEGSLEPGSVLYVPRGWGHEVFAQDELTLHLTITIPRANGEKIARALASRLNAAGTPSERPLPFAPSVHEAVPTGSEVSDDLSGARLAALDGEMAAALANLAPRATHRLRHVTRFLAGWPCEPVAVRYATGSGLLFVDEDDEVVRFLAAGQFVEVRWEALDVVLPLFDGAAHRLDLDAVMGNEAVCLDAARTLVSFSVLEVVNPDQPEFGVVLALP